MSRANDESHEPRSDLPVRAVPERMIHVTTPVSRFARSRNQKGPCAGIKVLGEVCGRIFFALPPKPAISLRSKAKRERDEPSRIPMNFCDSHQMSLDLFGNSPEGVEAVRAVSPPVASPKPEAGQQALDFDSPVPADGVDGLSAWRRERIRETEALARRYGLPLGHPAQVELKSGIRLEGILLLADEALITPQVRYHDVMLRIGSVAFRTAEIESCVRRDIPWAGGE